jgi:excisionase family DNA binding protein
MTAGEYMNDEQILTDIEGAIKGKRSDEPLFDKLLLSVSEVALLVGWNASTVYRKALAGRIPGCLKLDGSVRFKTSKIREWLEDPAKEVRPE